MRLQAFKVLNFTCNWWSDIESNCDKFDLSAAYRPKSCCFCNAIVRLAEGVCTSCSSPIASLSLLIGLQIYDFDINYSRKKDLISGSKDLYGGYKSFFLLPSISKFVIKLVKLKFVKIHFTFFSNFIFNNYRCDVTRVQLQAKSFYMTWSSLHTIYCIL